MVCVVCGVCVVYAVCLVGVCFLCGCHHDDGYASCVVVINVNYGPFPRGCNSAKKQEYYNLQIGT